MQATLSKHTIKNWASLFVNSLLKVCNENALLNNKEIDSDKCKTIRKSYQKSFQTFIGFRL